MTNTNISVRSVDDDPRRSFRAKRGEVKLALLHMLGSGSYTGYKLMQLIREKSGGIWRVSAGSVYPSLETLEREGLVVSGHGNTYGQTKYSINNNGRRFLSENSEAVAKLWDFTNGKDLSKLNPLEQELEKLSEALAVVANSSDNNVLRVANDIAALRKRVYAILAE